MIPFLRVSNNLLSGSFSSRGREAPGPRRRAGAGARRRSARWRCRGAAGAGGAHTKRCCWRLSLREEEEGWGARAIPCCCGAAGGPQRAPSPLRGGPGEDTGAAPRAPLLRLSSPGAAALALPVSREVEAGGPERPPRARAAPACLPAPSARGRSRSDAAGRLAHTSPAARADLGQPAGTHPKAARRRHAKRRHRALEGCCVPLCVTQWEKSHPGVSTEKMFGFMFLLG